MYNKYIYTSTYTPHIPILELEEYFLIRLSMWKYNNFLTEYQYSPVLHLWCSHQVAIVLHVHLYVEKKIRE